MNLAELSKGRNNNLDLIRFIAALLVILCHAYPLCLGLGNVDFLGRLTNNQMHLGNLAVCIFFFYGGFLIAKSAERNSATRVFFKARILRIFPPLIVVTFVLTFIVGPFLTNLSSGEYFTNIETYKYLLNGVMVLVHNLPGVFENNIYGATVNGPLWTLPVEFMCYIMCFLILKVGLLNNKKLKWTLPLFAVGYVLAYCVFRNNGTLLAALRPAGLFYVGILFYVYRDFIKIYWQGAFLALVGLVATAALSVLEVGVFLFLPYVLMYIGYGTKVKCANFAKYGEFSYGVYLCAWPVQQFLVSIWNGQMNPWVNFIITIPFAILGGFLLNRFVEKPITRWEKK